MIHSDLKEVLLVVSVVARAITSTGMAFFSVISNLMQQKTTGETPEGLNMNVYLYIL
jgi:hypothetical protein